jgi:hypothetical protein
MNEQEKPEVNSPTAESRPTNDSNRSLERECTGETETADESGMQEMASWTDEYEQFDKIKIKAEEETMKTAELVR